MLIKSIKLENLLSFGPETEALEMGPLNVLIGPNGSGKSNLIEAIGLLQAAPKDLTAPIREGGGIHDWIWRGEPEAMSAYIELVLESPGGPQALTYRLGFAEKGQRFELTDEAIELAQPDADHDRPYRFFAQNNGQAVLKGKDGIPRELQSEEINPEHSILAQIKDPDRYPELTYLGAIFSRMRLYREWCFGHYTSPRRPQKADLPNDFLDENGKNLGLILNRLQREPKAKSRILEVLRELYEGVSDFGVMIEGGTVQVFLQEGNISVPATRLSDGTLRYLCLLAILCHPTPPPLVCIEEPELGLHPDILPTLGDLLREASERCQLVVTTHSDVLVDTLTDTPDSVVVCEKHAGRTEMRRLDKTDLADWLRRYSLGELWSKGELGGNRW
ncbi:MAG: AAA family ATPase [Candidatus Thiosymbion ectosymbiont of Robbea hypermnestra]|nr:AAA family ATPase [Candidatus Thiosymbion ectosymbiont of Robbea hypermnestra]